MTERSERQALEGKLKKDARYLHIKTNKWHRAEDAYYDVMRHHLNQQEMIWLLQRMLVKYDLSTKDITKEILY